MNLEKRLRSRDVTPQKACWKWLSIDPVTTILKEPVTSLLVTTALITVSRHDLNHR